jgi:hypothetical protein
VRLWCGRVAIAFGLAQAAVVVVVGTVSAGTVPVGTVLLALLVVVGAVIARRHPPLIGGLLVFFGLIVIPILGWAINVAHGWSTELRPWGCGSTSGSSPSVGFRCSPGVWCRCLRARRVPGHVSDRYRHSALGHDTKSMWPSP